MRTRGHRAPIDRIGHKHCAVKQRRPAWSQQVERAAIGCDSLDRSQAHRVDQHLGAVGPHHSGVARQPARLWLDVDQRAVHPSIHVVAGRGVDRPVVDAHIDDLAVEHLTSWTIIAVKPIQRIGCGSPHFSIEYKQP